MNSPTIHTLANLEVKLPDDTVVFVASTDTDTPVSSQLVDGVCPYPTNVIAHKTTVSLYFALGDALAAALTMASLNYRFSGVVTNPRIIAVPLRTAVELVADMGYSGVETVIEDTLTGRVSITIKRNFITLPSTDDVVFIDIPLTPDEVITAPSTVEVIESVMDIEMDEASDLDHPTVHMTLSAFLDHALWRLRYLGTMTKAQESMDAGHRTAPQSE